MNPNKLISKEEKKEAALKYLEAVPIYRFTAMAIGVSEDTLLRWRKEDKAFADACEAKIALFVQKTLRRARPEFQLERIFHYFTRSIEITGKDGAPLLPQPILGGKSTKST